jgi:RNA polymerase sigma-70 factor (ECF subfamily)
VTDAVTVFAEHRPMLLGIAYRVLGRWTDAEDVVQDAWLRWSQAADGGIEAPRAYLVQVVTRLAIDRLRRETARRESYVGPWLPEPVPDPLLAGPDLAERVELADTVSIALLTVLESLSPAERAVFVLHEAFAVPYAEIAEALDRSEPAVRQMGHRAREHVRARRPRFRPGPGERAELTRRFLTACQDGDLGGLMELFTADVEFIGDGGGIGPAPLRAIVGADRVAAALLAIAAGNAAGFHARVQAYNGGPAIVGVTPTGVVGVVALDFADGRISAVHAISNPEKLGRVDLP